MKVSSSDAGRWPARARGVALAGLVAAAAIVPAADAGKSGRTAVVNDPKDKPGSLYDKSTYKRCDITEIKAAVKRKNLLFKIKTTGKQEFPNVQINLNTRGSKKSDAEYIADGGGGISNVKKMTFDGEAGSGKLQQGGKVQKNVVPLKSIGKPSKTYFQGQTCGEGAVDIAPGGNYFDDRSFDGTVDKKYKGIKTG